MEHSIDRKKVINELLFQLNSKEVKEQHYPVQLSVSDAEKILALLKEKEDAEPKWISIKDRYPEKEGFYLVSADYGNYLPWIAELRIFMGIKGFCNGAMMPCVGAWMPLPEPYKKGR